MNVCTQTLIINSISGTSVVPLVSWISAASDIFAYFLFLLLGFFSIKKKLAIGKSRFKIFVV